MPRGKHLMMIVLASLASMYVIRYLRAGNTALAGVANTIWPVNYAQPAATSGQQVNVA